MVKTGMKTKIGDFFIRNGLLISFENVFEQGLQVKPGSLKLPAAHTYPSVDLLPPPPDLEIPNKHSYTNGIHANPQ